MFAAPIYLFILLKYYIPSAHFFQVLSENLQINIDCDYLIYEPELSPNNKLFIDIVNNKYKGEVYLIGNALENSDLSDCIKSGYFVGKNL